MADKIYDMDYARYLKGESDRMLIYEFVDDSICDAMEPALDIIGQFISENFETYGHVIYGHAKLLLARITNLMRDSDLDYSDVHQKQLQIETIAKMCLQLALGDAFVDGRQHASICQLYVNNKRDIMDLLRRVRKVDRKFDIMGPNYEMRLVPGISTSNYKNVKLVVLKALDYKLTRGLTPHSIMFELLRQYDDSSTDYFAMSEYCTYIIDSIWGDSLHDACNQSPFSIALGTFFYAKERMCYNYDVIISNISAKLIDASVIDMETIEDVRSYITSRREHTTVLEMIKSQSFWANRAWNFPDVDAKLTADNVYEELKGENPWGMITRAFANKSKQGSFAYMFEVLDFLKTFFKRTGNIESLDSTCKMFSTSIILDTDKSTNYKFMSCRNCKVSVYAQMLHQHESMCTSIVL